MARQSPRAEPRLHLVLLDLDGTLADTLPGIAGSLNATLAEAGLPTVDPPALRPVVALGTRAIVAHALGAHGAGADQAYLRTRFLDHYARAAAADARMYPGMDAVLAGLAGRGIRWGVVTNKLERFARPLVARLDRAGACACLVAGDTALHPKPHPAPLLHACRAAGVTPARAVYVGDAEGDVRAGRGAGMRTVAAAYGYLADGADPHAWGASTVIDEPEALLAWLDATSGARVP